SIFWLVFNDYELGCALMSSSTCKEQKVLFLQGFAVVQSRD
ncbi:2283_t:CDS:2, partial [Gigaspora rosea]